MEAAEALVQKVLEGGKQFIVPHFQRPYAWQEREWAALWNDIVERVDDADSTPHFLGPIVTAPGKSIPEGVEKRLLIDGQQRLTTLVVLLTAIRDAARAKEKKVADRIQDLITNPHDDGLDHYKLLPTRGESTEDSDQAALIGLVDGSENASKSSIKDARSYFDRKLRALSGCTMEQFFMVVARRVSVVSIKLGEKDNPYRIFESLNGKGRALNQGDLIRNFFFMRIEQPKHEKIYTEIWRPMQKRLGEGNLTEFIRHDLISSAGAFVREADVYATLKERVERSPDTIEALRQLAQRAAYYEILLEPTKLAPPALRASLERIRRLDVTVSYPLLLAALAAHKEGALSEGALLQVLAILESYVVRRFVCGVPTYGLNKVLAPLAVQLAPLNDSFPARLAHVLAKRECPRDAVFRERIQSARLYGGGDRREKTKLLLERMEEALGHKERVGMGSLTIEHIMPQSLTPEWESMLGADAAADHEELLHTLGNLTLTGYNSELGNLPYAVKRERYAESHVGLNDWFATVTTWDRSEIERRAEALAERALQLWPWFGPPVDEQSPGAEDDEEEEDVTSTVPRTLTLRAQAHTVRSWAEVAKVVAGFIADLGDDVFDHVALELPKFLSRDATAFRRTSKLVKLDNQAYLETNLSSRAIYRSISAALEHAGVGKDDWSVDYEAIGAGGAESPLRSQQREFWNAVRERLLAVGKFASLPQGVPQHWYNIALGRTGIVIELVVSFTYRRIGTRLLLHSGRYPTAMDQLSTQRAEIEAELGMPLLWDPAPNKTQRTIGVHRPTADLSDRANWPAAIDELCKLAILFHKVLAPRVAKIER